LERYAAGNFNPRSPCGERLGGRPLPATGKRFQSTLPVRGATMASTSFPVSKRFQSTLPVRGATYFPFCGGWVEVISIHAPRAGSDIRDRPDDPLVGISIHAPRAGSDDGVLFATAEAKKFQSTLPVRGATSRWRPESLRRHHFNPRSPCGERPAVMADYKRWQQISIHAPRAGSDRIRQRCRRSWLYFNPRSPCGERRSRPVHHCTLHIISIHAPRAGSDRKPPSRTPP